MTDLNSALTDLAETIREDGYTAGLVEEIARDWDINPALLGRMFEQKHGKPASEWRAASRNAMRQQAIARALDMAIEESKNWKGGDPICNTVAGKAFTDKEGNEMIAITISNRGLLAIRVSNQKAYFYGKGYSARRVASKFGLI